MPNNLLAAIVEYCGCLPEHGEQFVVRKGEEGCQQEIPDALMHLPSHQITPGETWELTSLYIARNQDYRILQTSHGRLETVAIPKRFTELISPEETDTVGGETHCEGPYHCGVHAVWKNNVCWFKARTFRAEVDEALFGLLDKHRINGET